MEPQVPYGGFWIRLFARIIDVVVLLIPSVMTSTASNKILGPETGPILNFMMVLVMDFLYFGVLQAELEGTLGKKALGLALVTEDLDRPTIGTMLLRQVMYTVAALPLGLGVIWLAFSGKKQGWHDLVAKTVVVNRHYLDQIRAQQTLAPVTSMPVASKVIEQQTGTDQAA